VTAACLYLSSTDGRANELANAGVSSVSLVEQQITFPSMRTRAPGDDFAVIHEVYPRFGPLQAKREWHGQYSVTSQMP